jgi:hypothetical protein
LLPQNPEEHPVRLLQREREKQPAITSLGPPALPPPPAAPAVVASAAPALPPSRAGLAEQPKVTGVSDRATEGRRESKEDQIVAVLRSILEEEKRNTSAINEIEIPQMQTGIV